MQNFMIYLLVILEYLIENFKNNNDKKNNRPG